MSDALVFETHRSSAPVLVTRGLTKTFEEAGRKLEVLRGIELSVAANRDQRRVRIRKDDVAAASRRAR